MTTKIKYPINTYLLKKTKKDKGYTWEYLRQLLNIEYWQFKRIRDLGVTDNFEEFKLINDWLKNPDSTERKIEEEKRLKEIERQKILEKQRLEALERKKRLEEQKKLAEKKELEKKISREKASFEYRLRQVNYELELSKTIPLFKNKKYITKTGLKKSERKYEKKDFVRVTKYVSLIDLENFYYRFPRSIEVQGRSIQVIKETYIRHVNLSNLSREVLDEYFYKGQIEVFLEA